jgi:hypothetical protein
MVIASDAETQRADAANELAECIATATTEHTPSIPPGSATFPEYTKPRRSRFGPLLQVWHEWSSCSAVTQQAACPRIKKLVTASRTVELYLRQGQPCDY